MNGFTARHFELLDRWKGHKLDHSDPEQEQAYKELCEAYSVTENWAQAVKERLFPSGRVKIVKKPTNQAQKVDAYHWARIYPEKHSPDYLAYTVSISADDGFQIRIDTVRLGERDPVRQGYLVLRGNMDNSSPIITQISRDEGLRKTLPELVESAVQAIHDFRPGYNEMWSELDRHRNLDDEALLAHFDSKPTFQDFRAAWTPEDRSLFCRLARAVHRTGLDLWHINVGIEVRCGRKNPGAAAAVGVLAAIRGKEHSTIVFVHPLGTIAKKEKRPLTADLVDQIEADLATEPNFPNAWQTERPGLWPDQLPIESVPSDPDPLVNPNGRTEAKRRPLNTILYGPPGTGKTYATASRCMEICDGKTLQDDGELRARYGKLMDEGRIEFVTFHQSYGYEEFVEGIRPVASADKNAAMRLRVEPGVVKRLAERARKVPEMGSRRIFKLSMGDPKLWGGTPSSDPVFAECIDSGYALLDYGGDIDWSDARYDDRSAVRQRWRQDKNPEATAYDTDVQAIWRFRVEMRRGDIVVASDGYRRFRAVGEVTGDYEFHRREDGFHHRRAVRWHWHVREREGDPGSVFMEGRFHWRPVNLMTPSNPDGLIRYLTGIDRLAGALPHVLVIDEINRANISKVMGELITLLEEDKREGAENEVAVTLPYSGQQFTLPANLHILGTMNTADRSIALLDTALRRRFRFEEMLPKPNLLHEARERTGVDLPRVLVVLNERLEYLIDRDHQIGHAWLMEAETRDDVDAAMRYKIIPLIAEYFYDDWSKVRAVLGGTDHFVQRRPLGIPPGLENDTSEARYRWTVQQRFDGDAYRFLIDGAGPHAGSE